MPSQPRSCVEGTNNANAKVTMAAVPRKTAGNSGEKPGVCAKKAKDAYFISRHRL
jgi:hypothetical protein